MKNVKKNQNEIRRVTADMVRRDEINNKMAAAATAKQEALLRKIGTTSEGLSQPLVEAAREKYGTNTVTHGKKVSLFCRILKAFINPFTAILFGLATVSAFTDIILAEPGEADPVTVIIIISMVAISGVLRFVQETRSGYATEKLLKMIKTTISVERLEAGEAEIPLEEVVVGDIVHLAAGDMIPADIRILYAKDLFVSQSALTGESVAVEKTCNACAESYDTITEYPNLAFMGSNVISGTAKGVVIATGDDTMFGDMAKNISGKPVRTSFEKGVNSVSWLLIRFMMVMVPVVLFINGFTKGDWWEAALFAISVAVGLTPEMLPMIVTTCLAKGAVSMSKERTIIKNLNSIQNLGSIDILCTDKTGTLTQDKVALQYHLNIHGQEDTRVLRHAFLNSYYQTGLKNLMDIAIIERTKAKQSKSEELRGLSDKYIKVDEIPFDFERRRMSVVVQNGKTQMITKGAVEEKLYDARTEQMRADYEYNLALDRLTLREQKAKLDEMIAQQVAGSQARSELEKELYEVQRELQRQEYDLKVYYGKLTLQQQEQYLKSLINSYKKGTQARIDLEKELYDIQQQIREKNIAQIDRLAEGITTALANRYAEQQRVEEERIQASIDNWQAWGEEQVAAIQGQIDALDDLTKEEDRAEEERKKRRKIAALEQQLQYEQDEYNRRKLQEQLTAAQDELNTWLAHNEREDLKAALQDQIDAVNAKVEAEQDALQTQLDANNAYYDELTKEQNLQAEAQKLLLKSNQKEILNLIKNFAPEYNATGESLGEQLVDGFTKKVGDIDKWFSQLTSKVTKAQDQMAAVATKAADQFYSTHGIAKTTETAAATGKVTTTQPPTIIMNFNSDVTSPTDIRREAERLADLLADL